MGCHPYIFCCVNAQSKVIKIFSAGFHLLAGRLELVFSAACESGEAGTFLLFRRLRAEGTTSKSELTLRTEVSEEFLAENSRL